MLSTYNRCTNNEHFELFSLAWLFPHFTSSWNFLGIAAVVLHWSVNMFVHRCWCVFPKRPLLLTFPRRANPLARRSPAAICVSPPPPFHLRYPCMLAPCMATAPCSSPPLRCSCFPSFCSTPPSSSSSSSPPSSRHPRQLLPRGTTHRRGFVLLQHAL